MPSSTERRESLAFLGALCLFLSAIEYLFPRPIPFMRLGLANLPVLIGLTFLPFRSLMTLVLLKVVGQGLVNGTLTSYVFFFSAAGSYAGAVSMWAVRRCLGRRVSLVGVSLTGALASNLVQLALSLLFIFGPTAWVIAPLFLGLGTAAGLAVGLFAERFSERSAWLARMRAAW